MLTKKINVLITTVHLDHGGVEEVILTYAKLLDKERYDVTVACLRAGTVSAEIARIPGVRLVHIDTKSRFLRFFRFVSLARSIRADIVHNHACWYGHIAGTLCGAKKFETIHNMYFWFTPFSRWHYGLDSLLADRMIAVSDYVRRFTIDNFPLMQPEKFVVIRNGIHCRQFENVAGAAELRASLGISADAPVIGFVGRLTEQKGVAYLIDATRDLVKTSPEARIVIVGEGDLAEELRARAKDLPQVIFAGFQRDIPRYLAMFDIFVLPSLWEGLPMSILEAMASGKPVVATGVSGTPEVVVDNATGFVVEPKNVPQLQERLSELVRDKELRRKMGAAGRERVVAEFSAEGMVRATEALYEKLLGGRR